MQVNSNMSKFSEFPPEEFSTWFAGLPPRVGERNITMDVVIAL